MRTPVVFVRVAVSSSLSALSTKLYAAQFTKMSGRCTVSTDADCVETGLVVKNAQVNIGA